MSWLLPNIFPFSSQALGSVEWLYRPSDQPYAGVLVILL